VEYISDDWNSAIEAVSTRREFQRSTIRIEDPSLLTVGDYDVETGQATVTGDPVIYEGPARIVRIATGNFDRGEAQANPTTLRAIRVQIPNAQDNPGYGEDDYGDEYGGGLSTRIKRGVKVFVLTNPRATYMEGLIFTVSSGFQGSNVAARTFEAMFDEDTAVADG
jgi:hypothetical protein